MFIFLIAVLFGALGPCDLQVADAPQKQCVVSWATIFQVMGKLRADVAARQLSAIHDEDMPLQVAVTNLLREAETAPPEKREELKVALAMLGVKVAGLHTAGDANDQSKAETELLAVEAAFTNSRAFYGEEILAPAQALADRYTCPMHADVIGKKDDACPKCGMPLDQLVRPSLFQPGMVQSPTRTLRARVSAAPLKAGEKVTVTLHLTRLIGDTPITPADLMETHTKKIHLLIVDQSLTDYHHEHPEPTAAPGDYTFSFTPQKTGPYRIWADVRSQATGFQEYAMTNLWGDGTAEPLTEKATKLHAEVEGLRYDLTLAQSEIKAGHPVAGKLRITDAKGAPFAQLEPLMATYAHLVGFCEDYKTVLHIHPKGLPALKAEDRGGPELDFTFFAPKPGFVRLFAQVQIGGVSKFAPFGINVLP